MMGFSTSVVRFLAIYKGENNKSMMKGTLILALVFPLMASLAIGSLIFATSNWAAVNLFQKPELGFVFKGFACALPFYTLMLICAACARGFKQVKRYNSLINLLQPVIELLGVAGLFIIGYRLGGTIFGFGFSSAIAAGVGLYWMVQMFRSMELHRVPAQYEVGKQLAFSLSTLMIGVVHMLIIQTDRLMLGALSTAHNVGIFVVASLISQNARFILQSTNSIFPPIIADLYHKGDTQRLVSTYKSVTWLITALTVPLIFVFCFMSSEIMSLFGSEYASANRVLIILSLFQFVNVAVGSAGFLLVMTGNQKLEAINSWVVAFLNVVLNYIFIPKYGAIGAAFATGLSTGIINLLRVLEIYRFYGYHPYKFSHTKIIASSAIALVFFIAMKSIFSLGYLQNIIVAILSIVVYFYTLYRLGIDEEEKSLFLATKEKLTFKR
ncbi:MAG: hypothetical protein ETSY1_07365 [Candidatus Entotheonella factor]|uniref:Uncharacterized protein n=1 Tax=Entotheonella factor TaxID=1429438 RepID=W4LTW0_ENTF1|nr:MAG: hypothetical protein ETSY1_07365 [Candidatus Entotheonella factor]